MSIFMAINCDIHAIHQSIRLPTNPLFPNTSTKIRDTKDKNIEPTKLYNKRLILNLQARFHAICLQKLLPDGRK